MPPEYAMFGLYSEKSDVFSIGVIVLEIISGKKNASCHDDSQYADSLLSYVSYEKMFVSSLFLIRVILNLNCCM